MLSVTIPWDRSTASVKMDFVEMEPNAQVTVYNISFYLIFPYFSGRHSTRLKLVQECNVPNFCTAAGPAERAIGIRDVIQWVIKNKLSQRPLDFLN